jgi:hypothetical protein
MASRRRCTTGALTAVQVSNAVAQLTTLRIMSARPDMGKWPAELAAKMAAALPYCRQATAAARRRWPRPLRPTAHSHEGLQLGARQPPLRACTAARRWLAPLPPSCQAPACLVPHALGLRRGLAGCAHAQPRPRRSWLLQAHPEAAGCGAHLRPGR